MAATIEEVRTWLEQYPPEWPVWVDEGGLTLETRSPSGSLSYWFELGGTPEDANDG